MNIATVKRFVASVNRPAIHVACRLVIAGVASILPMSSLAFCQTPETPQSPMATSEVDSVLATESTPEVVDLERRLQDMLTGSVWHGEFSVTGKAGPLTEESYEIMKATKVPPGSGASADTWLLETRIKYGDRDLTVPLPLEIKWAGETPVITVDQLAIPGMGTFDARVLIRKGKYAGTWAHDNVGGHLFGTISKAVEE